MSGFYGKFSFNVLGFSSPFGTFPAVKFGFKVFQSFFLYKIVSKVLPLTLIVTYRVSRPFPSPSCEESVVKSVYITNTGIKLKIYCTLGFQMTKYSRNQTFNHVTVSVCNREICRLIHMTIKGYKFETQGCKGLCHFKTDA